MTASNSSSSPQPTVAPISTLAIDASSRTPVLVLFAGALAWLTLGSLIAVLSAVQLHSPRFLSALPWFTYGRLEMVQSGVFLYGFASQAVLALSVWLIARLGRTLVVGGSVVAIGAAFWNIGIIAGVVGILLGDSTGFAGLQFPAYSLVILLAAYLLIGIPTLLTFAARKESGLYVSQWYLLAALILFPWILSTAALLLLAFPVRGAMQAVVVYWFQGGFINLWLVASGIAAIYYFVPKISGRQLYSHYLALLGFWTLLLFGSWSFVPAFVPLPIWIPSLSVVAGVFLIVAVISVAINWNRTLAGYSKKSSDLPLRFILFGATSYLAWGLASAGSNLRIVSEVTQYTLLAKGIFQLVTYGFFAMVVFGAVYYILPQLLQKEWPSTKAVVAQFWLAVVGVLVSILALVIGGVMQGLALANPNTTFLDAARKTLPFIGIHTLGLVLLFVGHLLLLGHFVKMCCCCRNSVNSKSDKLNRRNGK